MLEPFGDVRADYRAAIIASTFYNMNRSRRSKVGVIEDFMPFLKAERQRDEQVRQSRLSPEQKREHGKKLSKQLKSFFMRQGK